MRSLVQCEPGGDTSGYTWMLNNQLITALTSNIGTDTINANELLITSMSRSLAGEYVCSRVGDVINTIMVYIVGK